MPEKWKTSGVALGKEDVKDCGAYGEVKLQEYAMKIVERLLENRISGLVKIDDMHFLALCLGRA